MIPAVHDGAQVHAFFCGNLLVLIPARKQAASPSNGKPGGALEST